MKPQHGVIDQTSVVLIVAITIAVCILLFLFDRPPNVAERAVMCPQYREVIDRYQEAASLRRLYDYENENRDLAQDYVKHYCH